MLTYSFELLPPKLGESLDLVSIATSIADVHAPTHINITSHAAGRISNIFPCNDLSSAGFKVVPHIFASGDIDHYKVMNESYKEVFLIRGDTWRTSVYELMSHFTMSIKGVAAYPESHPESHNIMRDIDDLKRKQDLGASYAITQMFFDNTKLYDFMDLCVAHGITIPIIPGLKPITTMNHLKNLPELFKCTIPQSIYDKATAENIYEIGIEHTVTQMRDLDRFFTHVHLFSMNRTKPMIDILTNYYDRQ